MAVEIVMPRVDMDMASGRMGRWHAPEGAHVDKGQTLFEIETDKAAMEVDAPASGVLRFVAASEGDVLPVGACIGWIVAEGETFVPPSATAGAPAPSPHSLSRDGRPSARGRAASPPATPSPPGRRWRDSPSRDGRPIGRPMAPDEGERPRATPAARRIARERGLRLESMNGSGPRGRVQARDVEARAAGPLPKSNVHRLWLARGAGAPIVFLHGFGADLNGWRPVHRLLPETRPALAIDLPGHGLTPLGDDASFEALVEAARAALADEGIIAAHLVGHSLGGAVAAALAQTPGVEALSLMLIAPAGLGEDANAAFFEGFLVADTEAALTPWLNMLAVDPAALGSALARTTLRQRQEWPLVADQRRLARAIFASGRQTIDVRGLVAAVEAPTKIVVGLEDRITPAHHADGLERSHRAAPLPPHRPHAPSRSAPRGGEADRGAGQGGRRLRRTTSTGLPSFSSFGGATPPHRGSHERPRRHNNLPRPRQALAFARNSLFAAIRRGSLFALELRNAAAKAFLDFHSYLAALVSLRAVAASVTSVVGLSSLIAPAIAASLCAPPAASTRTGAARTASSGTDITR